MMFAFALKFSLLLLLLLLLLLMMISSRMASYAGSVLDSTTNVKLI